MKKNLVVLAMVLTAVMLFAGCGKKENSSDAVDKDAAKNLADPTVTQRDAEMKGDTDDEENKFDIASTGVPEGEYADLVDLAEAQQKIAENYDENDPEATAKMMETYAEYGAKTDLREFENAESLDAPSDFPTELIYEKGKITEYSDVGDEGSINKSIIIETTEDIKVAKDFYKNLFSQPTWKLNAQSNESDGVSYDATDSADIGASVYISSDPYSKIVTISIWYTGSITE